MVNFYSTLPYRVMAKKKLRLKAPNKQNENVDFVEKTVRYIETDGQWCQIADVSLFFLQFNGLRLNGSFVIFRINVHVNAVAVRPYVTMCDT